MSGLPRPVLVGVLAILSAIGIWVVAADTIRRSTTLEPKEIESLLVLLIAACLVDGFIAYRAVRGRIGLPAYAWLGLRIVVSAAGLLLVTLPSYVVAVIAFSRRRGPAAIEAAGANATGADATPDERPADPTLDRSGSGDVP